jgi:hypothetical protein
LFDYQAFVVQRVVLHHSTGWLPVVPARSHIGTEVAPNAADHPPLKVAENHVVMPLIEIEPD